MLDNCEHLLDATARLVDDLLRAAPHVKVLATSREPLSIAGEQVVPVPPLSRTDAVRLFTDRGFDPVTVAEIAPGVDLKRDVLGQADIPLRVSDVLKTMDERIFRPEPFGLKLGAAS